MIFVDTSAWYSLIVTSDPLHLRAAQWREDNDLRLFTTDFIVDETLTLLRSRGEFRHALQQGRDFFESDVAEIYHLTPEDIRETWNVFQKFSDKEWSFTDCSSKVVMEKLGLETAFAFDRHFHQFGNVQVAP